MNSFEDLETWQKCRQLRNEVALLLKKFPDEEKYRFIALLSKKRE
jgi:hypothetical protein